MLLTGPESVERAIYHRNAGDALFEAARHQWSAVCYFYSAYHLVRGALSTDSIFDEWDALRAADSRLIPDDRFATRHQMRRGSEREFGVNDLVQALYPEITAQYLELHGASVAVRYQRGTNVPLEDLVDDLGDISMYLVSVDRLAGLRAEFQRIRA